MATLKLTIPDGENCKGCTYRQRRTDTKDGGHHCAIFMSRAEKKTRACVEHSAAGNDA